MERQRHHDDRHRHHARDFTTNDHDYDGRAVVNNGTVNWTAGRLRSGDGGSFTNNATFNDQLATATDINADYGNGVATFTNAPGGTYTKSGSDVTRFYTVSFNNRGAVNVNAGTLQLNAGGTNSGTGAFTIAAGGNVVFSSATYTLSDNSTLTGSGTAQLTGGTLAATGNVTLSHFQFNGGTLTGTQSFAGNLTWNRGTWNDSGTTTTIASGAALTISTAGDHDYDAHAVVNNGTVNWTAGRLRSGDGGSFTNNATFNDQLAAATDINADYGNGVATFINAPGGIYTKSGSDVTRFYTVPFNNRGTVNVNAGTLQLNAGGTNSATGVFNTASGATTLFSNSYGIVDGSALTGLGTYQVSGGVFTISGNVSVVGFLQTGGTFAGTQTFTSGSTLTWNSGIWNDSSATTLAAGSTLTIATGTDHDFSARAIVNNGIVNWTGGRLRSGNGGTVTNNATWNDSVSSDFNNDYGGAGGTTFINAAAGTYQKISGITTFSVPFNNTGAIAATNGSLLLRAGGTFGGGSTATASGAGVAELDGGVLTVNGSVIWNNFNLNGGELAGTQTFAGSAFSWFTGDWNTGGTTTLASGSTLTITGAADHDFNTRAIVNNGVVNWTGGRIRSGNGGAVTNNATWKDSVSSDFNNDYGGAGGTTFVNAAAGTYQKFSGVTTFSVPFNNTGAISVTGGSLLLRAGGTFSDGSTATVSGPGIGELDSGVLGATGNLTWNNFNLNGGELVGTQAFTDSMFSWLTGDWNTTYTTTLGATTTFTIAGPADHDFNTHAIVNDGTVDWTGGRLRSGNGGTVTNNATWNDSVSSAFNNDYGGSGGTTFLNSATGHYNKTAGVTAFLAPFVNSGTVTVSGGTLNLQAGGVFNDGSTFTSAATAQLLAGVLTANGTVGLGNFLFNGGELAGNPTFTGSFSWLNGDWNTAATTTIGATGALSVGGTADHDFNTHAIVNNGIVNWTGGRLRSGNGGSILNAGVWNDSASSQVNNDYGGTGGTTFTNNGVYNKTAAGTTTMSVSFINNNGAIFVSNGTMRFSGGFTQTAGTLAVSHGGTLQFDSGLNLAAGFLLGNGNVIGDVSASGIVSPSVGSLTSSATPGQLNLTGNLTLLSTSVLLFELGGAAQGADYDFLNVSGTAALNGTLGLAFANGFVATPGQTFTLLSSSSLSGAFRNVAPGGQLFTDDGLGSFQVNFGAGSSFAANSLVLSNFIPVPEPSTFALLALGACLLLVRAGIRRSRAGRLPASRAG